MSEFSVPWNELLWLLKRSWLQGDSLQTQQGISLLVADAIEERGEVEQAAALRGGLWILLYDSEANRYFVERPEDAIAQRRAWMIHWFPGTMNGPEAKGLRRADVIPHQSAQYNPPMEFPA